MLKYKIQKHIGKKNKLVNIIWFFYYNNVTELKISLCD